MDGWILFIYLVGLGGRCAVECILLTKVVSPIGKSFFMKVYYGHGAGKQTKANSPFSVFCLIVHANKVKQSDHLHIEHSQLKTQGARKWQRLKFANASSNNCSKFESGGCTSASSSNALCLHLLIGLCMWQPERLPWWQGPSVNLALSERFCRQSLGCQPLCPKQGIESAEECSAILADPRCVLNIKSSAVIPLAAPNTNRGLPVAMATALLSNIASGGSTSLRVFSFFLPLPCVLFMPSTSSLHYFFSWFCVECEKETSKSLAAICLPVVLEWTGLRVQIHSISSRLRRTTFDCSTLHFYFFFLWAAFLRHHYPPVDSFFSPLLSHQLTSSPLSKYL